MPTLEKSLAVLPLATMPPEGLSRNVEMNAIMVNMGESSRWLSLSQLTCPRVKSKNNRWINRNIGKARGLLVPNLGLSAKKVVFLLHEAETGSFFLDTRFLIGTVP